MRTRLACIALGLALALPAAASEQVDDRSPDARAAEASPAETTHITFGSDLPSSVFRSVSVVVDPSLLEVFARDCCQRDDVVEVYVDGSLLATIDSRGGVSGSHPGETHTLVVDAGTHEVEYRNTISSVGPSGWDVSETVVPFPTGEEDANASVSRRGALCNESIQGPHVGRVHELYIRYFPGSSSFDYLTPCDTFTVHHQKEGYLCVTAKVKRGVERTIVGWIGLQDASHHPFDLRDLPSDIPVGGACTDSDWPHDANLHGHTRDDRPKQIPCRVRRALKLLRAPGPRSQVGKINSSQGARIRRCSVVGWETGPGNYPGSGGFDVRDPEPGDGSDRGYAWVTRRYRPSRTPNRRGWLPLDDASTELLACRTDGSGNYLPGGSPPAVASCPRRHARRIRIAEAARMIEQRTRAAVSGEPDTIPLVLGVYDQGSTQDIEVLEHLIGDDGLDAVLVVVSPAEFSTLSAEDLHAVDLWFVGGCTTETAALTADYDGLRNNAAFQGGALDGRRVLFGSDPDVHALRPTSEEGASGLLQSALNWVGGFPRTGFIALSDAQCGLLDWTPQAWGLHGQAAVEEGDDVLVDSLNAEHPVTVDITTADVSGWGLSRHSVFATDVPGYDTIHRTADGRPVAIAADPSTSGSPSGAFVDRE